MKTAEQTKSLITMRQQQVKGKWRKSKKFYIFLFILLLMCILAPVFAIVGYQAYNANYHRYLSLAGVGLQNLRTGANLLERLAQDPLDAGTIDHARLEFAAAHTTFVQLDNGLESIPGISVAIPVYGVRLQAALHLASAAVGLSQAGVLGCSILGILVSWFHDPLHTQGHGLTMADFNTIDQDFQQMKVVLDQAIIAANQVQPGDVQFIPQVGKMITTFQSELPMLQTWLDAVGKLLPVLPAMLGIGTPAHYLVEVLDSTELRPTGGFIGNYGIATFSGGRLTSARITDVVLLDHPYALTGQRIPYPPAYSWFPNYLAWDSWSFRDSNLDADFPTAARYGELNYQREGGNVPVLGVIAITPALIQQALAITGPIYVPEYHETVTAQNLVSLIHFHQLGGRAAGEGSSYIPSPDGHSSERKRFMELLAEHFLARVQQLSSSAMPQFLHLLTNALRTKDVEVYFNAGGAENVLQLLHLDGTIQSPPGDHLFIVDTNVSPNKANSFIVTTVNDQVTIDGQGNAVHRTTISYAWTLPGRDYGVGLYRDYVRVYAPSGSTLSAQDGWQPRGASTAFGCQVWQGFFSFVYGQTRTITLVWTSYGVAKKHANGWHYQYLLQRQAGAQRMLKVQVMLPLWAKVTSKLGGFVSSGTHTAILNESWDKDLSVGLDYHGE